MATTTINTEPLDKMLGQLNSLADVDFEPLMLDFRAILERDNAENLGIDGYGVPLQAVTYRPDPDYHGVVNMGIRVNNNLWPSYYKVLDGPALAPRGADSRIVTNFRTSSGREGGAWVAMGAWEDVLSLDGVPFLGFHFRGEGHLPVRDLAHVRPSAMRRAKEALHDFAVALMARLKGS